MKRLSICLLAFALLLTGVGCGDKTKPAAIPEAPQESKTFTVTVKNASSYIFNELYVSPTAASEWGSDHLGSTNILKNNGSFDITLNKYEFENYDVRVLDEDGDIYQFTYVPLKQGTTIEISFGDGLIATLTDKDGKQAVVNGQLTNADGGDTAQSSIYDEDFTFTIYNESPYEIYAIYISPETSTEESVDVLPSTLASGASQDVQGNVSGTQYAGVSNWYLYVVDVDGDVSTSAEVFDPWLVSYIDVNWDSSSGGYVCDFNY